MADEPGAIGSVGMGDELASAKKALTDMDKLFKSMSASTEKIAKNLSQVTGASASTGGSGPPKGPKAATPGPSATAGQAGGTGAGSPTGLGLGTITTAVGFGVARMGVGLVNDIGPTMERAMAFEAGGYQAQQFTSDLNYGRFKTTLDAARNRINVTSDLGFSRGMSGLYASGFGSMGTQFTPFASQYMTLSSMAGVDNSQVPASAQTLYGAATTYNLQAKGVFTRGPGGVVQDPNSIIRQMYARFYAGKKVTPEQMEADFLPGSGPVQLMLDDMGADPATQAMVKQGLLNYARHVTQGGTASSFDLANEEQQAALAGFDNAEAMAASRRRASAEAGETSELSDEMLSTFATATDAISAFKETLVELEGPAKAAVEALVGVKGAMAALNTTYTGQAFGGLINDVTGAMGYMALGQMLGGGGIGLGGGAAGKAATGGLLTRMGGTRAGQALKGTRVGSSAAGFLRGVNPTRLIRGGLIAGGVTMVAGAAEAALVNKEDGLNFGEGAFTVGSRAAQGAALGSMFGPLGTAVGAVAGTLWGLNDVLEETMGSEEERERKRKEREREKEEETGKDWEYHPTHGLRPVMEYEQTERSQQERTTSSGKTGQDPTRQESTNTGTTPGSNREAVGRSKGDWFVEADQLSKIHYGEMVLPNRIAQAVRDELNRGREAQPAQKGIPQGDLPSRKEDEKRGGDVHIHLTLQRTTDAEAMDFARRIKRILDSDSDLMMAGRGSF